MAGILQIWFREYARYHFQMKHEKREAKILRDILKNYLK